MESVFCIYAETGDFCRFLKKNVKTTFILHHRVYIKTL